MKLVINEFVGYLEFIKYLFFEVFVMLIDKIKVIIIFVLCGFVNFSLIVILIGGLGGMVLNCCGDIVCFGIKVVIVGLLVNLMSVIIVGLFIGLGGLIV